MKTRQTISLLTAALGLGLATLQAAKSESGQAAKPPADAGRVQVVFQDPDKFTDVKDAQMESEKGRDSILDEIRKFIVDRAPDYLSPGLRLVVTFSDIDLAGDYEPWRMPPASDIRIVKAIYPPRMDFTYKVIDEKTGATVKEGREELRDLAFQTRLTIHRDDPLRYEKDMLQSWMGESLREFRPRK